MSSNELIILLSIFPIICLLYMIGTVKKTKKGNANKVKQNNDDDFNDDDFIAMLVAMDVL